MDRYEKFTRFEHPGTRSESLTKAFAAAQPYLRILRRVSPGCIELKGESAANHLACDLLPFGQELLVTRGESTKELRYLGAQSVRFCAGNLAGFRVWTKDAQSLGSVHGVLISPSSRQLRFFVIETPGLFVHRRFLLPAEAGAVVCEDRKTLQISAKKDELDLESFNVSSVQEFSDNDLLEAMFSGA